MKMQWPDDLYQDAQCENAILAYGEASGHAHQFVNQEDVTVFKSKKFAKVLFLDVKKRTAIEHGRARDFIGREADHNYHAPVYLDPGKYVTGIVEETDWITKTTRKVID